MLGAFIVVDSGARRKLIDSRGNSQSALEQLGAQPRYQGKLSIGSDAMENAETQRKAGKPRMERTKVQEIPAQTWISAPGPPYPGYGCYTCSQSLQLIDDRDPIFTRLAAYVVSLELVFGGFDHGVATQVLTIKPRSLVMSDAESADAAVGAYYGVSFRPDSSG